MKKNVYFSISLFLLLIASCFSLQAKRYFVTPNGTSSADGLSWTNSLDIRTALSNAADGDSVFVAPGEYVITGDYLDSEIDQNKAPFVAARKANVYGSVPTSATTIAELTRIPSMVRPEDDVNYLNTQSVLKRTAGKEGRVLTVTNGTSWQGFHIAGGKTTSNTKDGSNGGGGVWIASASTLSYCLVYGNQTHNNGGGIRGSWEASNAIVRNCIVYNNQAIQGGGIYLQAQMKVIKSTIESNTALSAAGGISMNGTMDSCVVANNIVLTTDNNNSGGGISVFKGIIKNSLIQGNKIVNPSDQTLLTGKGGGIGIGWESACTVSNCQILNNKANDGGGIFATYLQADNNVIKNCKIDGNEASSSGGGIYNSGAYKIDSCEISNNNCGDKGNGGGGIYMMGGDPNAAIKVYVRLLNSHIHHNNIESVNGCNGGGIGIYGGGLSMIDNCIIENNQTSKNLDVNKVGGAISIMYYGTGPVITNSIIRNNKAFDCGGISTRSYNTKMINCEISGNSARTTGGIFAGHADSRFINCTIVNNTSTNGLDWNNSPGIIVEHSKLKNCILWGNTYGTTTKTISNIGTISSDGVVSNTIYSGSTGTASAPDANGNFNADPLFVDAINGNYSLTANSPAVNAGKDSVYYASYPTVDLVGNNRFNSTIDLGAYEYTADVPTELDKLKDVAMLNIVPINGGICILPDVAGKMSIYTALGSLYTVRSVSKERTEEVTMPKGLYVVQINGKSQKIIVK